MALYVFSNSYSSMYLTIELIIGIHFIYIFHHLKKKTCKMFSPAKANFRAQKSSLVSKGNVLNQEVHLATHNSQTMYPFI